MMKFQRKRIVALLLTVVMILTVIPAGFFSASALNYSKSEFSIANMSDWNAVASCRENFAGKTVKLTADFDAGGATLPTLFATFAGTFDGQGHTIRNFKATDSLIAEQTSAGAVIKNVTIDGTLTGEDNNSFVGMLATAHDGTGSLTVSNVSVSGTVTGWGEYTAGLIAVLTLNDGMTASFENINVSATVNDTRSLQTGAPTHGCVSAAGVIGTVEPKGKATLTVKNVNVTGDVTAGSKAVGGVIGSVFSIDSEVDLYAGGTITISNANVTGTLSSGVTNSGNGVGGILGSFGGFKRDFGEYATFDGTLNLDNCVVSATIEKTRVSTDPISVGGILGTISYGHATVNVEHCLIAADVKNSLTATDGTGAGLILGMAAAQTMSTMNVNNTVSTVTGPIIGTAMAREGKKAAWLALNGNNLMSVEASHPMDSWFYTNSINDGSVLTVSADVANAMIKKDDAGFIKRVGGQITALAVQDNVPDGVALTAQNEYAIRFIGISHVSNITSASMEVVVRDAASGKAFKQYEKECSLYDALNAYDVNGAKIAYYQATDFGANKILALTIGDIPGGSEYVFEFTPSYTTSTGLVMKAETISISYDKNGQYLPEKASFDVEALVLAPTVRVMSSNILNVDKSASAPNYSSLSHEQRLANMAEMYMFYQPDFIGMQEVFGGATINHTATINMQTTLLSAMGTKYAFVDFTNKVAVDHHWTPIMYLKDKWTVIDKDIADEAGVEYANEMHRWQWAVFQNNENENWKLIVLNLHGPNNAEGSSYKEFQPTFFASVNAQIKMLEQKYPNAVISVTGDYNQGYDSEMLTTMIAGTNLANSPTLTNNHEFTKLQIDHIFLTKNRATVKQWREVDNYVIRKASDHKSVFADILLEKIVLRTPGTAMGWGEGEVMGAKYKINSNANNIKILGERYLPNAQTLYADWTCSGLEFSANVTQASNITFTANSTAPCYFKAYVDGALWKNGTSDYYTVNGKSEIVLTGISAGTHTVRLVKATGYTLGQAEISEVEVCGTISATAEKDLYIEFLGDSISCGWGVVGNHDGGYASQDGTLAYPYLVAQAMNADYSIMGLSGRGVVYGTDLNFDKNYLHASPLRGTTAYGFERKADIVVINLGTNDRGNHADTAEFEAGYVRLLENVFAKNGSDCIVYCLWGAMNDAYNTQIQSAIATYKASHSTAKIYTLELAASTVAGGAPSWGHPSISDHQGYTTALTNALNNVIS